mgnify:CR=1 FL=1
MNPIVMIDVESGGLDPATTSILSLGACLFPPTPNGPVFEVLLEEAPMILTGGALRVNKINPCAREPVHYHHDAWKAFTEWNARTVGLRGVVLGGHNTPFDIGYVKRLARLAGGSFESAFSHRYVDTMVVARFMALADLIDQNHACSLSSLCRTFKVVNTAEHTALGDAIAARDLLVMMLGAVGHP